MKLKAVLDSLEGVDEAFHALYTERDGKYELTGVEGMRTQADVDRLTTSLNKEREDHKTTKNKYRSFENMDLEEVLRKLDHYEELEAAAGDKLDETKMQELVESRIKTKLAPIERERDRAISERDEAVAERDTLLDDKRKRTISDAVGDALNASKGFQDYAREDALLHAERLFEIDDAGNVVAKDNVGVTPGITPGEWLTDQQEKRPHWWGVTEGGGAHTPNSGTPTGKNPFSHEHWNVTEQSQLVRTDRKKADQLAERAGTVVGGRRPAAPQQQTPGASL